MTVATSLNRDDIAGGLRELVDELRASGQVACIRLVGGAALSLRHFERGTTQDLDSLHIHPGSDEAVSAAAALVAIRHGWDPMWINFAVENADAIPSFGRRAIVWETVFDSDGVVVQIADKESLLAMKLRANRPGRDTNDIRQLLALCGIATLAEAEELYEDFYPGDGLTNRAVGMVERILAAGLPDVVASPGPITL